MFEETGILVIQVDVQFPWFSTLYLCHAWAKFYNRPKFLSHALHITNSIVKWMHW